MEIKCKKCGKVIVVDDDIALTPGQHVRCPYCNEKFSYTVEKVGISAEDLRTALIECSKDKELSDYYRNAPQGARLYLMLVFYGKVFRDELDKDAYVKAFSEIGEELKERDLRYLLQYEDDVSMRTYLSNRLISLIGNCDIPVRAENAGEHPNSEKTSSSGPKSFAANPAAERRMAMQARNEKIRAQVEEREWRRKVIGSAVNGAIICAILIVGWIVYSSWHDKKARERQERLDEIRAEKARVEEYAENERRERARQEMEDRARQDRERAERVEFERKERENLRRIAAEAEEWQEKINEERRIREAAERRQEEYDDILASLGGRELLREVSLPEKMRLGRAGCKMLCIMPAGQDEIALYEIETDTEGETVAAALSGAEGRKPVAFQELKEQIEETECIFCDDGKAYFHSGKMENHTEYQMQLDSQTFNPWDAIFGKMLPAIKRFNFECNAFALDVFLFQDSGAAVKVARLEPFDAVLLSQFKDVVLRDIFERRVAAVMRRPIKLKKPTITVKLYDGEIIKKDASRITYVPREFPQPKGYDNFKPHRKYDGRICDCGLCKKYRSWEGFYNEAVKQEKDMAEYEMKVEKAREKLRDSVRVSDDEVDALLKELRIRIAYAKEQADDEEEGKGFEATTSRAKSPEDGCAHEGVTDDLSETGIARLNARLRYKSFCGIMFGNVEGNITQHSGHGGELQTPFRHFSRYTKWGSKVFHRVAQIDLSGKTTNASVDSFKKEIRQTAAVLSKKYGMTFTVVSESGERMEMKFEDQYAKVVIGGDYSNGEASFHIRFNNKQIDSQNDEIWAQHPGEDISMPDNAGFNVL